MTVDIRKSLKKSLPHLLKAQEENLNEADTVLRIVKVFEDVLGYDPLGDITRESPIHDKYVDIAIKVDGASATYIVCCETRPLPPPSSRVCIRPPSTLTHANSIAVFGCACCRGSG